MQSGGKRKEKLGELLYRPLLFGGRGHGPPLRPGFIPQAHDVRSFWRMTRYPQSEHKHTEHDKKQE